MRVKLTILLLSIIATSTTSRAQDAEASVKQFEGKTLILRHPLMSDSQRYDADGKVLKGGKEGSWTVYSGVLVDHVTLTTDKLLLAGRRVFFLFPENKLVLFEFTRLKNSDASLPLSPLLTVEINLGKRIDSAEHVQAIFQRVFALDTATFLKTLPDFWRIYLQEHHFDYEPSQQKEAEYHWRKQAAESIQSVQNAQPTATGDLGNSDTNQPTFHIGKNSNVKAPQAKFTPAPEYSAIAQYENYRGVVIMNIIVGTDGKIDRVRLARPLGMGLDEAAVAAVQTWRFQPSTHNGQPVAVEMNIEAAFNLY